MEYALLYTFSTIAQALGGAFALLAAFGVYRFQSSAPLVGQYAGSVRAVLTAHGENNIQWYDALLAQGKLPELISGVEQALERIEQRAAQGTVSALHSSEIEYLDHLRSVIYLRTQLTNSFRNATWTTGGTMLFSVTALPFAHIVWPFCAVSWFLLAVGVGGFLACLIVYWAIIKTAIYRQ